MTVVKQGTGVLRGSAVSQDHRMAEVGWDKTRRS